MIVDQFNRPMRDLRISVIDACNYRCTYCMPLKEFSDSYSFSGQKDRLNFDEITKLVRIFVGLGITKVRITGGEPLLRKDLPQLIAMIKAQGGIDDLAMTTNGHWLEKFAESLKSAGLMRVSVSLDSLNDGVFGAMNGRGFTPTRALTGIRKAKEVGFDPIKINVLVQKGVNDHGLIEIAKYFKGSGIIVRFIEYMDVGNRNGWKFKQVVPAAEIFRNINNVFPIIPKAKAYPGEVVNRYEYVDGSGEIGFIASVTRPFCQSCNRIRLSSDGVLYTCLFANDGTDLRTPMRNGATDPELEDIITNTWKERTDRYSELRAAQTSTKTSRQKIEMYQIGG